MAGDQAPEGRRASGRPRLRRRAQIMVGVAAAVLVVFATLAGVGLGVAHSDRTELLNHLDPALQRSGDLLTDLINQETAVRGLMLVGNPAGIGPMLLEPYRQGLPTETVDRRELGRLLAPYRQLQPTLAKLDRDIATWQTQSVLPVVNQANKGGPIGGNGAVSASALSASTAQFDAVRADLASLNEGITHLRQTAAGHFDNAFWLILAVTIGVFFVVAILVVAMMETLRRLVIRPLVVVGTDSRRVAAGEFDHPVADTGPAEIADLANDIEAMRSRIVQDLRAIAASEEELKARSEELARSNRDLEQFAYVASHDLQEPLRKVASFCQLLSQRYRADLDERGLQYLDFAVDEAKRMQSLVNDLLAFSRVGRTTEGFVEVETAASLRTARANLGPRIADTGASVVVDGTLPVVRGDPALLGVLFQNLIGNSIKFRGKQLPVVTVTTRHRPPFWEFTVADNGIGIEPRFAERVFVIFQRLHTRDRYEGTGIGLALCRKIVEFHGGNIWIDTDVAAGAAVRFTLPEPTAPSVPLAPPADTAGAGVGVPSAGLEAGAGVASGAGGCG